jgi:hypothetical protein
MSLEPSEAAGTANTWTSERQYTSVALSLVSVCGNSLQQHFRSAPLGCVPHFPDYRYGQTWQAKQGSGGRDSWKEQGTPYGKVWPLATWLKHMQQFGVGSLQ